MTIEQLVKELSSLAYKSEEKKIERLKKLLKTDYIEYHTKMSVSKQIIEQSRYIKVNDKMVYSPNGCIEYQIKIIALIQLYYDIQLRDGEDRVIDFNLIEKNNLSKLLIDAIGEDIVRFNAVYGMTSEDVSYKESFVPFISSKFDSVKTLIDGLGVLDNPEIRERMADWGTKLLDEKK